MKKKTSSQSAFFNPRSVFGFALCCIGLTLAIFALTRFSIAAQPAGGSTPVSAAAPQILKGVEPVLSESLLDMPVIPPSWHQDTTTGNRCFLRDQRKVLA